MDLMIILIVIFLCVSFYNIYEKRKRHAEKLKRVQKEIARREAEKRSDIDQ